MNSDAYTLSLPDVHNSCMVFASPHSGRDYTPAFIGQSVLNELQIRSSEDAYMDRLVGCVVDFGAPFLAARMPRAFVDLNRACDEMDPAVIEGAPRPGHNPRIASGLGVIARVVANGRAIYSGKLSLAEAEARIEAYWRPYHTRLERLMHDTQRDFGRAVLIDCHSMPHEAVQMLRHSNAPRPDVVIGDRFGASADEDIVERVEAIFTQAGLRVSRNSPFAGAYITQTYGRPSHGHHAIQIEIDRGLYLNEALVKPSVHFDDFQVLMAQVLGEIAEIGRHVVPLAAE